MTDIIPFSRPVSADERPREDRLWAVMAEAGRTSRIAEIYPSRDAALADRYWREQQVRAYAHFLRSAREPIPRYSIAQLEPAAGAGLPARPLHLTRHPAGLARLPPLL